MAEEFLKSLRKFFEQRNEVLRVPQIGGKELDLFKLYKEVVSRGGFQQVSNNKLWKEVVTALDLPSSCTSASYNLRQHYHKILFAYEQENFFSKSERSVPVTEPEPAATSKPTKKIKVTAPMMANTRRMILAFDSKYQTEVNWAINTLLLFSCNTAHNYQLESNGLVESILSFLQHCLKKLPVFGGELPMKRPRGVTPYDEASYVVMMEQVKAILLVLRNLSMIRNNEIILFKCNGMIEAIIRIFSLLIDKEITQNCLEFLTNLAKHIFLQDLPNYRDFLCTLMDCLQSDLAESAIECFRKLTLPISNEEIIEQLPQIFFDELAKWLVSTSQSKDSVLEILCNLSDQSLATKVKIANAPRCIEGLVKLLTSISQTDDAEDKQAKISAMILNNLSGAPKNVKLFVPFDTQIFAVAASDERISGLLCNVLFEIQDLKSN